MNPILSMHMWISLTQEQRTRIRNLFRIPRSSYVLVNDGVVETDGTTVEDFKHLTLEKMQEYLKDDSTDFHKLFDKVIARVQDEIEGRPFVEEAPIVEVTNAKPTKNAKKSTKK